MMTADVQNEKNLRQSLTKLSLDKDFAVLNNRLRREVNVFDVLKIADAEIRHSNVLAWLLDPNQSHGLGDTFVKAFFKQVTDKNPERGFDFRELNIYRERSHTDIMLEYNVWDKRIIICVENKIHAGEGSGQLARYEKSVNEDYPDSDGWQKYFVFLTLDGHESSHPENWQPLDYEFIINLIRGLLREHEFDINVRPEMIIKQYLTILERQVYGMDKETEQLLTKLKRKYPDAVQAIAERFSDDNLTNATSDAVKDFLAKNASDFEYFHVNEVKTTRSLIRCQTGVMDRLFPNDGQGGGWGDGHKYFYEIGCYKDGMIKIKLVFSLDAFEKDGRGRELIEKIREIGDSKSKKEITDDRQWVTAHVLLGKTKFLNGKTGMGEENSTDVLEKAEEKLRHVLEVDIPEFEKKVQNL